MADEKRYSAVYAGFQTFKNSYEGLVQGIPNQIDRSTFPGLSGGVQSQLFAAYKFLGLTNDDGVPTQALHDLAVPEENTRKEVLKNVLQERYPALFALDLMKTTPQQLATTISEAYDVTGDTRGKAVRFFVSAAQYAGIPMSRLFGQPTTNGSAATKKRRRPSAARQATPPAENTTPNAATGTSRSVTLRGGGTLTLSATVNWLQLSSTDRNFVFGLIDKLEEYEKGGATEPAQK